MSAACSVAPRWLRIGFVSTRLGTTDGVSLLEDFGNAFLQPVCFRRPIVVNDYTIDAIDIKPKGFRAIELNGFITEEAVAQVEQILRKPALAAETAERNYRLAKRFYSFAFLEHQLQGLLQSFTGEDVRI